MIQVKTLVLGPVQTNVHIVWDEGTKDAVVIDPAWDGDVIAGELKQLGLSLKAIWLTHAHFDHFAGTASLLSGLKLDVPIVLNSADLDLWNLDGGAPFFGLRIERGPKPNILVEDGDILSVGGYQFEVRHTPGHTPGHVVFYCQDENLLFSGDVIFSGSIGRTDLPGGSYSELMKSIWGKIMSLPDETRLCSGHGPQTSVGAERIENPFLIT